VLLRLAYLAVSSIFAVVRLLPVSDTDKDIEFLALRHQLAVLQRQIERPRPTRTDRVFLAALLHHLSRVRLRQLQLIVSGVILSSPGDQAADLGGCVEDTVLDAGHVCVGVWSWCGRHAGFLDEVGDLPWGLRSSGLRGLADQLRSGGEAAPG
jgi:hypothetical protein